MSSLAEDDFKDRIAELRRTAPEPPPVHWGAYRAELREKLERRGSRGWAGWSWRLRPIQAAVAAGFVAGLPYIRLPGPGHNRRDPPPPATPPLPPPPPPLPPPPHAPHPTPPQPFRPLD